MRIKLTTEAKNKLVAYAEKGKKIILDLDDGLGRFSGEGDCALITKFRVIIVDSCEDVSDYSIKLNSSLGDIYFKESASEFLQAGLELKVNPKTQLLVLKNDHEMIDNCVNIIDFGVVKSK
ncbi:iron-sulfur cluster biosynthesis family protein [Companilactobacillus keshanensis]|uniref:Iron-sulfur cluster biosynthesis family protein n=1 Tax=Companilactobacillus keshanensis TaxID=2486003 RepID=A0ABW4BRD0_9LACO|nr:iron-sulfur cluster biosynthesis family protein [Companilactobacillus keshanensis]